MGLAELLSSAGTGLTNAWDSVGEGFTSIFGNDGWFGTNSEGIKSIGGLAGSMSTIYNTNRKNNMMENYYNTEMANTAKDRQESDAHRAVLSSIWDGTYQRNTAGTDQSTTVS